jgi:hypothetical protein
MLAAGNQALSAAWHRWGSHAERGDITSTQQQQQQQWARQLWWQCRTW